MSLNEWFEKGLPTTEYVETLENHKDGFLTINEEFSLPEDTNFFELLQNKDLRIIVLAEPWCGHCMLNIPVLFQIAKQCQIPVKVLLRDSNLELMDQYLTNEKRIIPIFIFINIEGEEVAKWGPIAPFTREYVDQLREKLPPKDSEEYQDTFNELIKTISIDFIENEAFRNATYQHLKQTVENSIK